MEPFLLEDEPCFIDVSDDNHFHVQILPVSVSLGDVLECFLGMEEGLFFASL